MPATPNLALPYPAPAATPDVPYDVQQLAEAVEDAVDYEVLALPLAADYGAFSAAVYETPGIRHTGAAGRRLIQLEGSVGRTVSLAITANTAYTIGTLPVGYRPAKLRQFTVPAGVITANSSARVIVNADGTIQVIFTAAGTWAVGGNGYLGLDGIAFRGTQ